MKGYSWRVPREPKLIRDAVHGYQLLARHEVPVVDSPLLQRLRGVHQTALAHLVYPTATHTRFDHSLGVARMVQGMIEAMRSRADSATIPDESLHRVRLAALLHDCGHLLFSHLGETVAADQFGDQITEAKEAAVGLFEAKSLGEIISYLMVTSPTFASGLDQALMDVGIHDVSADRIAPLILGSSPDPGQQFEADMISGPYDADKLDYLLRDCHFSGIRTTVDIERVYYTVRLLRTPGQPRSLAMHVSGVPNLEQILFAKMILFTSVYHHQKVRALECQFRGIIERLERHKDSLVQRELKLNSIADWLRLSEDQFFVLGAKEPAVSASVKQLARRELLKRALVISVDTVTESTQDGLILIYDDAEEKMESFRQLRLKIFDGMGASARGDISDLWLDVPDPPTVIRDVLQVKITADQLSHRPLSSSKFQWDKWTNNYGVVKWRSHVFCPDRERSRRSAAHSAAGVLRADHGIVLTKDAREFAKN